MSKTSIADHHMFWKREVEHSHSPFLSINQIFSHMAPESLLERLKFGGFLPLPRVKFLHVTRLGDDVQSRVCGKSLKFPTEIFLTSVLYLSAQQHSITSADSLHSSCRVCDVSCELFGINYLFYATFKNYSFLYANHLCSHSQPRWPGCNQKSTFSFPPTRWDNELRRGREEIFSCFLLFIWIFFSLSCDSRRVRLSRSLLRAEVVYSTTHDESRSMDLLITSLFSPSLASGVLAKIFNIFISLISAHHHDHQGAVKYLKQLPSSSYSQQSGESA